MHIKMMIPTTAKKAKVYDVTDHVMRTPGKGARDMTTRMTRDEALERLHEEAKDHARERGIPYAVAREKVLDANPELKEYAYGPGDDGSQVKPAQRQRADQHLVQRIAHHKQLGYSEDQAIKLAQDEERSSGLHAIRAALPKGSPWAAEAQQEQQDEAHRFSKLTGQRPGEVTVKVHAARPGPLSSIEHEKLRTARETLVKQVAADCLHRGRTQPDDHSWRWVDCWFGVNVPPPPPTPGTDGAATLAAYNLAREAFLDEVMEAARVILRDPQAANLLRPTRLGR